MRAQTAPSMTENRPLACPSWCSVPAEVHERDFTDDEGAIHWSAADGLRVALCTDTAGRVDGGPDIYLGDPAEPLTPADATALAERLLAAVAMCSETGQVL